MDANDDGAEYDEGLADDNEALIAFVIISLVIVALSTSILNCFTIPVEISLLRLATTSSAFASLA